MHCKAFQRFTETLSAMLIPDRVRGYHLRTIVQPTGIVLSIVMFLSVDFWEVFKNR